MRWQGYSAVTSKLVVLGLDTDPNIVYFVAECIDRRVPISVVNLRELAESGAWDLSAEPLSGTLSVSQGRLNLAEADSVFWRPIDLSPFISDQDLAVRWQRLYIDLRRWMSSGVGGPLIVNHPGSHRHNKSKPLHEAFLQACGFNVPESLTTADVGEMNDFMADGRTVAKSITGERSNAFEASPSSFEDGPPKKSEAVHLQRLVKGIDIRAHVIGTTVIALGIVSYGVDYRPRLKSAEVHQFRLPATLETQIIEVTALQELAFSGWDFKLDSEGVYWCLECNPMPAFAGFDKRVDGEISRELIAYLTS